MSKFENLLINQTEKQLSILNDQSQYYSDWLKAESKFIDRIVINESFQGGRISENWEGATFIVHDYSSEIKGRWTPFNGLCGESGLYLTNRIIRFKEPVTLKSLALEVNLNVKLSFNSEIWIVTRGSGVKDPNSAIVRLSKESEVDGIFIVFGSPIGPDSDFVFFKRQQIPDENYDPNEDFTDLRVKVKDNGDDRVYVSVHLGAQGCLFQTYCNKFIPSLVENKVMIAGAGKSAILENITLQQKERSSCSIVIDPSKRHQCCRVF
jgi:hypothetical protein